MLIFEVHTKQTQSQLCNKLFNRFQEIAVMTVSIAILAALHYVSDTIT